MLVIAGFFTMESLGKSAPKVTGGISECFLSRSFLYKNGILNESDKEVVHQKRIWA